MMTIPGDSGENNAGPSDYSGQAAKPDRRKSAKCTIHRRGAENAQTAAEVVQSQCIESQFHLSFCILCALCASAVNHPR
jgi:hypothetical protein